MIPPVLRIGLMLGALALLAGCEYAEFGVGPDRRLGALASGRYHLDAWSDFGGFHPIWSGRLDLRVARGGSISGSYRLPRQCVDAFGRAVDCTGRVRGRIDRGGRILIDLDRGWFTASGTVHSATRATGRWDVRLPGFHDRGTFDLIRF
jgi:hypothetical protein